MFESIRERFAALFSSSSTKESHIDLPGKEQQVEPLVTVTAPTIIPSSQDLKEFLNSNSLSAEIAVLLAGNDKPVDRYDIVMQFPYGERQKVFHAISELKERHAVQMTGISYGRRTLILTEPGREAAISYIKEHPEISATGVAGRKMLELSQISFNLSNEEKTLIGFLQVQDPPSPQAKYDIDYKQKTISGQQIINFLSNQDIAPVINIPVVMKSLLEKGLIREITDIKIDPKQGGFVEYYSQVETVGYALTALGQKVEFGQKTDLASV